MSGTSGKVHSNSQESNRSISTNELWKKLEELTAEVRKRGRSERSSRSGSYNKRRRNHHYSRSRRRDTRNSSSSSRSSRHNSQYSRYSRDPQCRHSRHRDSRGDTRSQSRTSRDVRSTKRDARSSSRRSRDARASLDDSQKKVPSPDKEDRLDQPDKTEPSIDTETPLLLGEAAKDEKGPKIDSQLAECWEIILQKGLDKDARQELLKKYPPSENCLQMKAPLLNAEVESTLSPHLVEKENYQVAAQTQLAAAISATGSLLTNVLIRAPVGKEKVIQLLSDTGRMLTDLQPTSLSIAGRAGIIPTVNPLVKSVADECPIDSWLFGSGFSQQFKAAQDLEKSSKQEVSSGPDEPGDKGPGGRALIREAFRRRGISQTAEPMSIASIPEKTLKQYEKPLKLWWSYCQENEVSVFEAPVAQVLTFLSGLFEKVQSYSTLNCYRSALSLIMGQDLRNDPAVQSFFKGVGKMRRQKPKYADIWDPTPVLKLLESWGTNAEMSLGRLSRKLVTLLALVTTHRVKTLAKIRMKNIIISRERIQIKITDKMKTTAPNRKQPLLNLQFFNEKPLLCAASTLITYLDRTKNLKSDVVKTVILTCKKPYHAATPHIISRWIKRVLAESGINSEIFSAHSTGKLKRVNLEIIRKTAGWTERSSVFARFYQQHIANDRELTSAVLNQT